MEYEFEQFKILGMSDSTTMHTGYSNQCKNIFKRLAKLPEFDISLIGWQSGISLPTWIDHDNDTIYTRKRQGTYKLLGRGNHQWAWDVLPKYLRTEKPDLFFVLSDMFMIPNVVDIDFSPAKFLMYFPSDGDPFPKLGNMDSVKVLKKCDIPVAMSKFAKEQYDKYVGDGRCRYIPHGLETQMFYPYNKERKMYLRNVWGKRFGIDLTDKFILGSVGRFQGRKAHPELLKIFAEFAKDKNDVVLLCHFDPTDPAGNMIDIFDLMNRYNLQGKLFFTGTEMHEALPDSSMPDIYNLFDVHVLATTGEGFCCLPDTQIFTENGIKQIKDITDSEKVLTHKSRFMKSKKLKRNVNEKLIKIKTRKNNIELTVTMEHPIFTSHGWKLAEDLEIGDELAYILPITKIIKELNLLEIEPNSTISNLFGNTKRFGRGKRLHSRAKKIKDLLPINEDLIKIIAWYVSEGCSTKDGLVFCLGTYEQNYIDEIKRIMNNLFNLKCRQVNDTRNRTTLWFNSSRLGRIFKKLCNSGAHNKRLPNFIYGLDISLRKILLDTLIKGDGSIYFDKRLNNYEYSYTTVSPTLSEQIRMLMSSVGIIPSLQFHKIRKSFTLKFYKNNFIGRIEDNLIWLPIKEVEKIDYSGEVYNLEVDEDHTYLANGKLVHNCIPLIESMSCGIPSMATDFTTTKELITDTDCGWAIPISTTITGTYNVERAFVDKDKFIKKLNEIYVDRDELKSKADNCRPTALKYFDFDSVVFPQWLQLFKEVLE